MLDYAYGVLYALVEKACSCARLEAFVRFLHPDNYNKKSLVDDLIEPFRILGDRATVLLFTGRRVLKDHFEKRKMIVTICPGHHDQPQQLRSGRGPDGLLRNRRTTNRCSPGV